MDLVGRLEPVCLFSLLALAERPRLVADDILEYGGHGGLTPLLSAGDKGTGRRGHYDDVGRHQPPESAHIQRFHVAGGRGELPQPVQVTDKEWMCDR